MNMSLRGNEFELARAFDDLRRDGIASIPNFLTDAEFDRMGAFVDAAVARKPGSYVGFNGPAEMAGSGLDELGASDRLHTLAERIYEHMTGKRAERSDFYQVLRCLSGPDVNAHSHFYHYDSYVVTLLVPIRIPTRGKTGDFLLIPNARHYRRSYWRNAADKVLLDNRVSQRVLRFLAERKLPPVRRVKLEPGRMYFFNGYRTIHTNEPCDQDQLRATALFHFANPHAGRSRGPRPAMR